MGSIGLGRPRVLAGVAAGALAFFVTPGGVRETPQQTSQNCRSVVSKNVLRLEGTDTPSVAPRLAAESIGLEATCRRGALRSAR